MEDPLLWVDMMFLPAWGWLMRIVVQALLLKAFNYKRHNHGPWMGSIVIVYIGLLAVGAAESDFHPLFYIGFFFAEIVSVYTSLMKKPERKET